MAIKVGGTTVIDDSRNITNAVDLTASGSATLSGGTANGVAYLNGSKVLTSGSALTFDGTTLNNSGAFGTSTAALTLKNSSAYNSSNIVEQQFFAANSFTGLDTIAKFGALNPSAGANNYGAFYWSLANLGSPSEQMRLTSTGLGIGTSSPAVKLDVNGSIAIPNSTQAYQIKDTGGTGRYVMYYSDGVSPSSGNNLLIGNTLNNAVIFFSNNTERMRIDSSGNVGIGVTPSAWNSGYRFIQFPDTAPSFFGGSNYSLQAGVNAFINSSSVWVYNGAAYKASRYEQFDGVHAWYRSTSTPVVGNDVVFNQAMTLDASGNLLVGQTTRGGVNSYSFDFDVQNGYAYINHSSASASGRNYLEFVIGGTTIGSVSQAGTTGVLYNVTSDYRLKTVIGPVADAGQRIDALQPVEYTWNANGTRTRGFLAHKFQEVYAGSVTGEKDAVDEEGKPVYQSMQAATSEVIADLVAEIQSLRKRLAALEAK